MISTDPSLWSFVADASGVVKIVMLILLIASVASWTLIFQRATFLKRTQKDVVEFENDFWSGEDLQTLYDELPENEAERTGLENIFYAGFTEFSRLSQGQRTGESIMQACERAMRVAVSREIDQLENHLSFLATVGSTSPYVGLFGTVWGIMTAFRALANVQQATIAMVAPGISEALVATAMGLFAAIPAVIAYNRFNSQVERLANYYQTFQEEFTSILHRQVIGEASQE